MENIKRFVECTVPITACNLHCSYCYIIQEGRRNKNLKHKTLDPELIGRALRKERLGGICYISLCGAGETLFQNNIVEVVAELLNEGHYVNITTNGTITKRFNDFSKLDPSMLKRLHFAFSLHYLELKRLNLLEEFFRNIKLIRNAGCSYTVQLNFCDEYIPHLSEIKKVCIDRIDAMPQIAVTRNEKTSPITIMSELSLDEYSKYGESFESPLFAFTLKNFMVKRKEFCYAGDWSFKLDLATGILRDCYDTHRIQKIYDNVNAPLRFCAIGNCCRSPYCVNSSHFMSLGIIPEILTPSYMELRDRPNAGWYTLEMREFLDGKLEKNNIKYSVAKKIYVIIRGFVFGNSLKCINIIKKIGGI